MQNPSNIDKHFLKIKYLYDCKFDESQQMISHVRTKLIVLPFESYCNTNMDVDRSVWRTVIVGFTVTEIDIKLYIY